MYRARRKIIASILVFVIMFAYFSIVEEAIASSLEAQSTQTNQSNVEFDAYFMQEKVKTHSAIKTINEENYLYAKVTVKEAGYLKNAAINLQDANFRLLNTMPQEAVTKVEESKIELNQIKNNNAIDIVVPISILQQESVNKAQFNKENKIKLTGTYVDGNGKEKKVEKEIIVSLGWTAQKEAILNTQIAKFVPYAIGEEKGIMLQTIMQSYLKDNVLPIQENKIEIIVPNINGVKPQQIKVAANTIKATNGDEIGENFTQENYKYDEETNKLTITVTNEENENGNISWQKNAIDEFVITYIYPEVEQSQEGTKIAITANSELTVCESNLQKVQKQFVGEVVLTEKIGNLVDFTFKTNVEELSKGQIYANYNTTNKIETEYEENITAIVGLAEITDKIELSSKIDNFLTADETAKAPTSVYGSNYTYFKQLKIEKNEFDKILGENGYIKIYSGATLISTIDKTTEANEEGNLIINLADYNINDIKIETSKPLVEGKLEINIIKAIKGDIAYNIHQMKEFANLQSTLNTLAYSNGIKFVDQELTTKIGLKETTTQAELVIDNTNLSTVVTNKDVKLSAILKTDTLYCNLYKDPTIQIILPKYIENINIKNIEVLFDIEGNKLNLKDYQLIQNDDGTKTILINLEGTQTEYTLGAVSKGVNVVITSDISVNKLTPNKQEQIRMIYSNNNVITKLRSVDAEMGETQTPVNFVAPTGVVTTSSISNYVENGEVLTSISGEEKTANIATLTDSRIANFEMTVINNYNNTIDNISILGRLPFKGNKNIVTQANLGSTINMALTEAIRVNNIDTNKVTIYYSENGDATKDLNLSSNGWTATPTSLENVKSYLIVLTDYSMNVGESISFNYNATIPASLQHNESAYENYVVYFNNNLATGMIGDKQVSTKIGITTGRGPVIQATLSSDTAENTEVLTGNMMKYTLSVKNTGTEDAQNVIATITMPEGLSYVEEDENTTLGYKIIAISGNQATISLGNIGANQTLQKTLLMKAGIIIEDTLKTETKAIISAGNISGQLETNKVTNTVAKTYYIVSPTILDNETVLKEGNEFTYYMEVVSSNVSDPRADTVVEIVLPKEIEYQGLQIQDKVKNEKTDITSQVNYNYDTKTRKLTINLGEVNGRNPKAISLKVKVGTLEENVYNKQTNINAKVYGKDVREQPINIEDIQIGKIGFKVTQTSNIPENTHIAAYEDLKYIFTIENLSNMDLYNLKFTDILPEELTLNSITATRASGNTTNSYTNNIKLNINGRETITVEVNVGVTPLDETITIVNKAELEYEGMETLQTSTYKHIIDKYEFDDSEVVDPSNQTKRIMGQVWEDKNNNGTKDENETKMSGVNVLLFNNQTGKLLTDSTGNVLKQTTDKEGSYTFANISKGRYTVIYLYDTANYSATIYRKDGVDDTKNSDAVDSKITLDGVTRVAGITEEIKVSDNNIYNIDLGLISNPKFDLKLDKTVSKITVQDTTGTKVYEYNNEKLAKKDLVGKQVNNTTIIVEYKIKVTNEGAVPGFVKKIVDYIPSELKFSSELNRDWYTSENGAIYNSSLANTVINPGETKEVTLLLSKKMTEENLGLYNNTAEIYEAYNDLGLKDIDSTQANKLSGEDDMSSADVLITVKTGKYIIWTGLAIGTLTLISLGVYFIKKKVLK